MSHDISPEELARIITEVYEANLDWRKPAVRSPRRIWSAGAVLDCLTEAGFTVSLNRDT